MTSHDEPGKLARTLRKPTIMLLVAGLLGTSVASPAAAAAPATMPTATVEGGLDKQAVREVVRANIEQIRDCYNAELIEDDSVEGSTVTSFVIQPDGSVHDAGIIESTMPERFDACLTQAIGSWWFPASDDETRVSYPFHLSPG
jgi:outer membrane biosynthesis protein TonB